MKELRDIIINGSIVTHSLRCSVADQRELPGMMCYNRRRRRPEKSRNIPTVIQKSSRPAISLKKLISMQALKIPENRPAQSEKKTIIGSS